MAKEESNDDEDFDYSEEDYRIDDGIIKGETVDNRMSAHDFDTSELFTSIKMTLNGFTEKNGSWVRVTYPICRTEFIINYINSIRSLVHFTNMFSVTKSDESAFNMLESLKEITYYAVDSGVKEEHIETLVNIYDTIKSSFYGITNEGRGTENVKQTLISAYKDIRDTGNPQFSNSPINWDYVNRNILSKNVKR